MYWYFSFQMNCSSDLIKSFKFCEFSAFSLEFQKFFSVAKTIFFTVGQNYFRKKIQSINWPFFAELEKKFGIFTGLFTHDEETEDESKEKEPSSSTTSPSSSNFLLGKNWRDLIPVVKVSYSTHLKKTKFEIKICPLPQKWSR